MKHCVTISTVLQTAVRQTDDRQTVRHTNTFLQVDWFGTIDLITLWKLDRQTIQQIDWFNAIDLITLWKEIFKQKHMNLTQNIYKNTYKITHIFTNILQIPSLPLVI